ERVALQIQKQVTAGRHGQAVEAEMRLDVEQELVQGLVRAAPRDLQPRLLAHPLERTLGDAVHAARRIERTEFGDARDLRRIQSVPLPRRNARDQRQMVVRASPLLTALPPTAHPAVFDGLRISLARSAAATNASKRRFA